MPEQRVGHVLWDASAARLVLHVLTYGRHTATNEFRYVKHMLLLGLNFLGDAYYVAAAGAAGGMDMIEEVPDDDNVKTFRDGSLQDHTLQAILRGHARMGNNGGCGECEVVVVTSKRHGLNDGHWRKMFPNVTLVEDEVLAPKAELKGKLRELAGHVLRRLAAGETEISNVKLYTDLKMAKGNYTRLVKDNPQWLAWVEAQGLALCRLKGGANGLRKVV